MLKHIKKKFLLSQNLGKEIGDVLESAAVANEQDEKLLLKNNEDFTAFMMTTSNEFIQAFPFEHNKQLYVFPEINPITLYFNLGQQQLKLIRETKLDILRAMKVPGQRDADVINLNYKYFSMTSICTIFSFISIDAFINLIIPDDYEYKRVSHQKTELFNKAQIQRELSFDEKIKSVIPNIEYKEFHISNNSQYNSILQLKSARDEIVHTKANKDTYPNYYRNLFIKLLELDYNKCLMAVRDYINFYRKDLIEECGCGKVD